MRRTLIAATALVALSFSTTAWADGAYQGNTQDFVTGNTDAPSQYVTDQKAVCAAYHARLVAWEKQLHAITPRDPGFSASASATDAYVQSLKAERAWLQANPRPWDANLNTACGDFLKEAANASPAVVAPTPAEQTQQDVSSIKSMMQWQTVLGK